MVSSQKEDVVAPKRGRRGVRWEVTEVGMQEKQVWRERRVIVMLLPDTPRRIMVMEKG